MKPTTKKIELRSTVPNAKETLQSDPPGLAQEGAILRLITHGPPPPLVGRHDGGELLVDGVVGHRREGPQQGQDEIRADLNVKAAAAYV